MKSANEVDIKCLFKKQKRPLHKNKAQIDMDEINERLDIRLSCSPKYYEEYTKWKLKHLLYLQELYGKRKIARLKMEKIMRVEKTLHLIKNNMAPKNKHTLIMWGDATIASNSPVKGYVRTPKNRLLEILKQHRSCQVVMQDEFRTTKLCCKCHEELDISTNKHRYAVLKFQVVYSLVYEHIL